MSSLITVHDYEVVDAWEEAVGECRRHEVPIRAIVRYRKLESLDSELLLLVARESGLTASGDVSKVLVSVNAGTDRGADRVAREELALGLHSHALLHGSSELGAVDPVLLLYEAVATVGVLGEREARQHGESQQRQIVDGHYFHIE